MRTVVTQQFIFDNRPRPVMRRKTIQAKANWRVRTFFKMEGGDKISPASALSFSARFLFRRRTSARIVR